MTLRGHTCRSVNSGLPINNMGSYIFRYRLIRIFGLFSFASLLLFVICTINPIYLVPEKSEAATKSATPSSLTFNSTRTTAEVSISAVNSSGSFGKSSSDKSIAFNLKTNNATGYTLKLKTSGTNTNLTHATNSSSVLTTLSSSVTETNFSAAANTSYNDKWGLLPSKYGGSANTTTYYPASSTGFTMDTTTAANSTANNYTVGVGARMSYNTRAGNYSNNTLVAEYVANAVSYAIYYYSNTTASVTGMPSTNPQTGTINAGTTSTSVNLASAPTRTGYTFKGWCLGASGTAADYTGKQFATSVSNVTVNSGSADTCNSTTYDAGQSFGINAINGTSSTSGSTTYNDTYYLYAMWEGKTYTATIYYNDKTSSGTVGATPSIKSDNTTTCTVTSVAGTSCEADIANVVKNSVGQYNNAYAGISASTGNMTAAHKSGDNTKVVLSASGTYYAYYSTPVTLYYPYYNNDTLARGITNLNRNQWFTSTSAMSSTVLSTSATGTTNYSPSSPITDYTIYGYNTSDGVNTYAKNCGAAGSGNCNSISAIATHSATTWYMTTRRNYFARFCYNNNTTPTSGTSLVTSTAISRYRYIRINGTSAEIGYLPYENTPTGHYGTYNNALVGWSVGPSMTTLDSADVNNYYGNPDSDPGASTCTFYAVYRANVTVVTPSSTSAAGTATRYRNQYVSSASAMSTTVLSDSDTGTSNYTQTATVATNYSFAGFANAASTNTITYAAVSNLAASTATKAWAVYSKSVPVTFYYNNNTTDDTYKAADVKSTTASATQFLRPTSDSAAGLGESNIEIPAVVTRSFGVHGENYLNVGTSTSNMTAVDPTTASNTYYARYSERDSSNNANITVYKPASITTVSSTKYFRNQRVNGTSSTSMSDAVLATTSTGTSNFTYSAGISGYSLCGFTKTTYSDSCSYTSVANVAKTASYYNKLYAIESGSENATFYYNNNSSDNPTSFTADIKSTTGSGTRKIFAATSSQIGVSEGTVAVPSVVSSSKGTHGEDYLNVGSTSAMSSQSPSTGGTYYAHYSDPVTIYKPSSATTITSGNYHRNQRVSSTSAVTTVLATANTTASNFSYSVGVSGYSLCGFSTATDGACTYNTVANAASANAVYTALYATESGTETVTFYYSNKTASGCAAGAPEVPVTSTTASGTRKYYPASTSTISVYQGPIEIPSAVSSSAGTYCNAYVGVNTTGGMRSSGSGSVSPTTANLKYYAYYRTGVTNYYYNGSAYTSRTLRRNQYVTSDTTPVMSDTWLATTTDGTSNYTTATGPGSSVWTGLTTSSTASDLTPTYTTVAGAAKSTATSLYTIYTFNVDYLKGTNTSAIGAVNGSCKVRATGASAGGTSCTTATPSITSSAGYIANGWSTTKDDANAGTTAGYDITLTSNATTYYGNSKPDSFTITLNKCSATNTPSASTTATYLATTLGAITVPTRSYTISGWTTPSGNNADGATVNGGTAPGTLTSTYTFNGWYSGTACNSLSSKVASSATTPALQASVSGYTDANSRWTKTSDATLYASWTSQAKTLPTITKTGYTCGWTTTATGATSIAYASGGSLTPSSNTTLYGVCVGNTYTATIYYYNKTSSGIASTTAQCTVSNSAGNCNANIPNDVLNSVGTYNNAYKNLASTTDTMDKASNDNGATITLSANGTYYATYSTPVTLYYPYYNNTTLARNTTNLNRNQWFTSTSAMSNTVLSTSITGTGSTTNYAPTSPITDYAIYGYNVAPSINTYSTTCGSAGTSNCTSISAIATSVTTTWYMTVRRNYYARFCYNNNTTPTVGTSSVTSTAISRYRYIRVTDTAADIGYLAYQSTPTGHYGTFNNTFVGWSVGPSMTTLDSADVNNYYGNPGSDPGAGTCTFYAVYRTNVTNYYYNGSAYAKRTLYRNQYVTSSSALSTTRLSTSSTGTSNYSTAAGPGSSAFVGFASSLNSTATPSSCYSSATPGTSASTVACTSVARGAYSTLTTLNTVYQFNVTYSTTGSTGVSSVGTGTTSCKVSTKSDSSNTITGDTSCSVTTPTITTIAGYASLGWAPTEGHTTVGTTGGNSYVLNSNPTTLFANAKPREDLSLAITFAGTGVSSVKVCTVAGNCSGSNLKGTVSTSGNSVTGLTYNQTYYLYPTFTSGYELDDWTKTSSTGTLSSTSDANPTFTMGTGNSAVTITGKATIKTIANASSMQEVEACDDTIPANTQYTLTDSRDNKTYTAAKIGNTCWMTKNLDLAGGTTLTPANSNVDLNFTLPASSSTGWTYSSQYGDDNIAKVYNSGNTTCNISTPCYSYYNYAAATVGTNGTVFDICPKGWRLPSRQEAEALISIYNTSSALTDSPFYSNLAGWYTTYNDGSLTGGGSSAFYWLADTNGGSNLSAYHLTITPNINLTSVFAGYSVRCVVGSYHMDGYLQDQTVESLAQLLSVASDSNSQSDNLVILKDKRDEQEYSVSRIGDLYWMTKNLNIAGGTTLTPEDTNISTIYTLPDNGDFSGSASVLNSNNTACTPNNLCYSYYTYQAATAGWNFNDEHISSAESPQDICPRGWRLPTSSEYYQLITDGHAYSGIPFQGMYSGYPGAYGTGSYDVGSKGYYWTSSYFYNDGKPTGFLFERTGSDVEAFIESNAFAVRCVKDMHRYLQDQTPETLSSIVKSASVYDRYLIDKRDNIKYSVQYAIDGNYWLVDNLKLDLNGVSLDTLIGNTNATAEELTYLKNGGGTTSNQYATSGVKEWKNSSFASSNSYSDPLIATSGNGWKKNYSNGYGGGQFGVFYNYCAASAGSYCYGNGSSGYGSPSSNATSDICPKGWRMPTNEEYKVLYDSFYDNNESRFSSLYPKSGYYDAGTEKMMYLNNLSEQYAYYLWTSTYYSSTDMYDVSNSNSLNGQILFTGHTNRGYGLPVRCMMKAYMQDQTSTSLANLMPDDGDTINLYDKRDNKKYSIAKIGDAYWMTTNLDLAGGTTLTPADSNVTANYTLPASSTTGFDDPNTASVYNSGSITCSSSSPCYSYYSFKAASAGTSSASITTGDVNQDICPKGWRLPTSAEYSTLMSSYATGTALSDQPFKGTFAGFYLNGELSYGGTGARYWTSTISGASYTDRLSFNNNSNAATIDSIYQRNGFAVRCIMKNDWMQNQTLDTLAALMPSNGNSTYLHDARDGKKYSVAKIGGLYYMTTNLDLAGGTTLTPEDSNVTANYTLPASSNTGFSDNNVAKVYNSGSTTCSSSSACYSYYSFVAASAGTGGTSVTSGDVSQDICPKGWRLPTSAEYTTLISSYTTGTALSGQPFNGVFAGFYLNNGFDYGGIGGRYWSSTISSSSEANRLFFNSNSDVPNSNATFVSSLDKKHGFAVRCVAKMYYMQDQTIDSLANLMPDEGDVSVFIDSRDGKYYSAAKIIGKYWMTRNLDLAGGSVLTSTNSNVTSNYTLPASSKGYFGNEDVAGVFNSNSDDCASTDGCYSYYSFMAASAGTGGSNVTSGNVSQDICPKGWRLPSFSEYSTLSAYLKKGDNSEGTKKGIAPFLAVGSGYYNSGGSLYDNNVNGYTYLWTSRVSNASSAYSFDMTHYLHISYTNGSKRYGYAVRCVADM